LDRRGRGRGDAARRRAAGGQRRRLPRQGHGRGLEVLRGDLEHPGPVRRRAAAAVLFGAIAARALADDARAIARARDLIDHERTRTLAPGVSVAVARDGRLVWSEAIGCADVELQVPMAATTRLRIGSVSKPLTAAALGRLVEDGKLDLD